MAGVKKSFLDHGNGSDPLVASLEANVGRMKSTFDEIQNTLETYDTKLISVLGQHQDDFWFAFKTHMNKIEKELQILQSKSKEQDNKLTQDVRIISLEKQLEWYQREFRGLMEVKERNDDQVQALKEQCKNLGQSA